MVYPTANAPAVTETIRDLLRLNTYSLDMTVGDRRLIERTQAWVQALDALYNCLSVTGESDTVRGAFLNQIADTISATGFWEAWVEVLIFEGSSRLDKSDLSLFKIMLAGQAGTDDTRLPFGRAS